MIYQVYRYVSLHFFLANVTKKLSKYVMLRQEMESYPIFIGACAHNKEETNKVKTHDDEFGGRLVHKYTYCQQ